MEGKTLSSRMIKRVPLFLSFIVIFFVGLSMPSFFKKDVEEKIKIMTSIFPLMEFAEAVVGDRGDVDLLLPPGAEVHTWQPKPSDLVRLSAADLFIYIGAELEPWAKDILRSVKKPKLRILEICEELSLPTQSTAVDHGHGAVDPHIWLDFYNDQIIIEGIAVILGEMDPAAVSLYKKNAIIYNKKLQDLDRIYTENLRECEQRTIVLGGHAAFGYLAQRYNLHQVSLYGLSPDSKPTPSQLINIIELVKESGIKAIYFEVRVSSELAEVIAEETGAKTLVLNPGASLSKKQMDSGVSFLEIMRKNLENLKDGLSCH
jgi:zinc transport system substrate-binding protein